MEPSIQTSRGARRPSLGHGGVPVLGGARSASPDGGTPVEPDLTQIRPIEGSDVAALQAFYAGLSEESRRTRFFGPTPGIGSRQSQFFCSPDHDHREGFVAVAVADVPTVGPGEERIVGHICIEPEGPDSAELAVAVAEQLRGRGIGRHLVEEAIAWARAEGLLSLSASTLGGNPAIQRLLTSLGLACSLRVVGAGVVEIRLDLDPLPHRPPVLVA